MIEGNGLSDLSAPHQASDVISSPRTQNEMAQIKERLALLESLVREQNSSRGSSSNQDSSSVAALPDAAEKPHSELSAAASVAEISNEVTTDSGHRDSRSPDGRSSYTISNNAGTNLNINSNRIFQPSPIDPSLDHVSESTQQYILDLYWMNYNVILPFVDREMFTEAKRTHDPHYFSKSLYLCILAVGLRVADMARPQIKALLNEEGERNTLHVAAKRLVESDIDSSKGLPRIQALLLLGDVEAGLGHYTTGWMYIGWLCSPPALNELTNSARNGLPTRHGYWVRP